MGPPTQKKKKDAKTPVPETRTALKDSEFRMEPDLRDPWEGEKNVNLNAIPKKEEPEEEGGVRAEKAPKNKEESLSELAKGEERFGNRIKALRAKMEEREAPKYHRGRKRKNLPPAEYTERKKRLGSVAGIRPKKTKKGKKKG